MEGGLSLSEIVLFGGRSLHFREKLVFEFVIPTFGSSESLANMARSLFFFAHLLKFIITDTPK